MEEEIEFILDSAKEHMTKTIDHLEHALIKIRAGRANPEMLESVRVEYYGSNSPLSQVSNINTPDARTITVQPWEKGMIPEIEKAILNSGLGFNPSNNGEMVIINVPPLTEERRRDLVKMARHEAEESRIGIRNARKEANDEIKKLGNDGLSEDLVKDNEEEIQNLTNSYIKQIDDHLEHKEKEIMTV
ncbi:MAG: ribosome recycling factor [Schleiferiaceae bacterium]|jgi:ribosome recycling factor|nr:ribosome recycling factor [Schleiferiaceae bacterium]